MQLVPVSGRICPHWQQLNPNGQCIDKWWAGPPVSWIAYGAALSIGAALLGLAVRRMSNKPGILGSFAREVKENRRGW